MDKNTILLIQHYESCRLYPYLDSVKKPTIGWGSTYYENGTPVTMNDPPITQQRADDLFSFYLEKFYSEVYDLLVDELAPTEVGALTSLAYNIGIGNFKSSTLLRKVNQNVDDPTISDEFLKWSHAGGKVLEGLLKRRKTEAHLYFTGELVFS